MNPRSHCICSAQLQRRPFSINFDAMSCSACRSQYFVALQHDAEVLKFKYDTGNEKYSQIDYLYGKQLRWAHNELLKLNWSGRKVLEIGCFNGFFLDELRKKGAEVYGFDVNEQALTVGINLFNLSGRLKNSIKALNQFGPFDDVICIDVLEHLQQPEATLSEISMMLKPQGRVVIAGPIVERGFHDKSDYPPHHAWWFSSKGLQSLLTSNQFLVGPVSIQRDGLLLIRNFFGKLCTGLSKREFYGETQVVSPSFDGVITNRLYSIVQFMGTVLFTLLRIPYCSAIIIGTKAPST